MSDCIKDNWIARGDNKTFVFSAKDENNDPIPNLGTASDIIFMLKESPSTLDVDASLILSKTANPTQVLIDAPATGDIKVVLTSQNTTLEARDYTPVINVVYSSPDDIQKVWFFNKSGERISTFRIVNIG